MRPFHRYNLRISNPSVWILSIFCAIIIIGTGIVFQVRIHKNGTKLTIFQGVITGTKKMGRARMWHSATTLPNGNILIVGGLGKATLVISGRPITSQLPTKSELFLPLFNTFISDGRPVKPNYLHTATLLNNGKVLIVGGRREEGAELYDPDSGTYKPTGNLSHDLIGHTATLLHGGEVLIAGGDGSYENLPTTAELYIPSSGIFVPIGRMVTAGRQEHTANLLADGNTLIIGGRFKMADLAGAELYDPSKGNFRATGSLGQARHGHTATLLPNGKVLIVGGMGDGGFLNSAELYDPATGTFSPTGNLATAKRTGHTTTLLPDGKVLIVGGQGLTIYGNNADLSISELYDPATGTFTPSGRLTSGERYAHTATLLGNGKVLVVGGYNTRKGILDSAEIYDPVDGTFRFTGIFSKLK